MPEACLQKVVRKQVRANAFFRRSGVFGLQKTIRVRPGRSFGDPFGDPLAKLSVTFGLLFACVGQSLVNLWIFEPQGRSGGGPGPI